MQEKEEKFGGDMSVESVSRGSLPSTSKLLYHDVRELNDPLIRYNVFGVVVDVLQSPTKMGAKVQAKVRLQDESMRVEEGKISSFSLHILARDLEHIPKLQVGCVVRVLKVKVEMVRGVAEGHIYRGANVTSVCGGLEMNVGPRNILPLADLGWGEGDSR